MENGDQKSTILSRIAQVLGIPPEDLALGTLRSQTSDCVELIKAFLAIENPADRKRLLVIARDMSGDVPRKT